MRTVVQPFPIVGFNGFFLLSLLAFLTACASFPNPSAFHERVVGESAKTQRRADLVYHLLAGEFAARRADFPAALRHYRRAARRSDDLEVLKSTVKLALHGKNYADAIRFGRQWVKIEPDNAELKQLLAMTYVLDRRFKEALLALEDIVGHEGVNEGRLFTTLGATLLSEMPVEAKDRMREMAEHFDDNARAQYVYAAFLLDTGDYIEVARRAAKATRLDPGFANAYLLGGWALILNGQVEQGLSAAAAAVVVAPGNLRVRASYARLLLESGRSREALEAFRIVHKHRPDNADVIQALGILSMQQEDFDGAADFFEKLGAFPERSVEADYYKGRVAEGRGEMQRALAIYREVPQGPFFRKAQISIASVYTEIGKPEQAVKQLEFARSLVSEEHEKVEFYLVQGSVLSDAGRHHAAIEIYTRAIKEHGEISSLLYARALAAAQLDLLGRVEADLGRILQDEPENVDALNSLGYILADHNVRLEEARAYIRRAYTLQPNNPAILDSMGWVEFRLKNIEVAESFIRRAIAGMRHPEVFGHLSEVLCARGRVVEAAATLAEALVEFPDDDYLKSLRGRCAQ